LRSKGLEKLSLDLRLRNTVNATRKSYRPIRELKEELPSYVLAVRVACTTRGVYQWGDVYPAGRFCQ